MRAYRAYFHLDYVEPMDGLKIVSYSSSSASEANNKEVTETYGEEHTDRG